MSMGMGFSLSQRHGLSMAHRLSVAESVGAVIVRIGQEIGMPTRGYEAMCKMTSSLIADDVLRVGVVGVLNNRGVRETIIESPEHTTIQEEARLAKLMVSATHKYHRGDFAGLLGPIDLLEHGGKVPLGIFSIACLSPLEVAHDRAQILRVMQQGGGGAEFQLAHLKELDYCCRLADMTQDERAKSGALIKLALNKLEGDRLSPLMRYSRELVFQREYLPVVADRLLARLSSAAIQRSGSEETFERALRSAVCEFVLLAMGIVTPGLSHPGDGEMLAEVRDDPARGEKELGFDLAAEFERRVYKQRPVSLNESLLEIGARGGELLGDFLGGPFGEAWPTIFKSLGGREWLGELRAEARGERERSQRLDSIFVGGLELPEFHELMKQLIVRFWYPALDPYLSHRVSS